MKLLFNYFSLMDLKSLKEKALKLKDKAIEFTEKTVDYGAEKLAASGFTISSKKDLELFIEKSKQTTFKNKETGKETKYSHRVIVIFGDEKSDFFKKALFGLPVIKTKGFTQNTPVKLAKSSIKDLDLKEYNIEKNPSLVVFENTKFYKTVAGEENILKLVKSFSLDINKAIEEMK